LEQHRVSNGRPTSITEENECNAPKHRNSPNNTLSPPRHQWQHIRKNTSHIPPKLTCGTVLLSTCAEAALVVTVLRATIKAGWARFTAARMGAARDIRTARENIVVYLG
jgi:hypothetical protein